MDCGGEPLLVKKARYYPGCPGCRVDRRKAEREGSFPFTELFLIWLVTVCSTLPIQSLFPFLYFMIRDLHIAKDDEDIGFYAGFVGASYMLGRALSSVIWGIVADKYGRKPVIVITLISVSIFNTIFGLSSSYWMALTTRGLLGLFCGMLGPVKAYATEVCRKEYNHMALAAVSSSRGIGLVVGPAIGGYLAQPADKYPGIFSEKSIFGRFPYFLPCLSISLLAISALIACFWLPETLHKHTAGTVLNNSIEVEEFVAGTDAQENGDAGSGGCLQLFTNWPLMSAITVYCIFSLQDVAYAEVFPLWAVSDRTYGGLSFSSQDVGNVLAISGVFLLIYQILIYPSVAKSIEPITLVRTIAVTTITVFSILMNDAVSQDVRASANGVAVTLMSIAKTIAPAAAGAIFFMGSKASNSFISSRRSLGVLHAERVHSHRPRAHLQTVFCQKQREALDMNEHSVPCHPGASRYSFGTAEPSL
ncbi:probable peptide/nitrate transporter At3g43790 isoform X2 [Phragmites australis]|uniref:probable peptide/nitrate transporter At3g43790 isoform X2 n=1 Tax=Phragmites australis TaxID=29695 RepID=UPI002D792A56|nr:probable peptide/nitrate transporter At3g43790 isoform X2 [Phragmites australis]